MTKPKSDMPIQDAVITSENGVPVAEVPKVDESALRDEWYKEAAEVKNVDELEAFVKKLCAFEHQYNTIIYAVSASALAAARCTDRSAKNGGITGFQAGAVMWEFVTQWFLPNNKLGMRLWDYDELMYPQYEEKFTMREIPRKRMDNMIAEAKRLLAEAEKPDQPVLNEDVKKHWQSIADGVPPFGFQVIEHD